MVILSSTRNRSPKDTPAALSCFAGVSAPQSEPGQSERTLSELDLFSVLSPSLQCRISASNASGCKYPVSCTVPREPRQSLWWVSLGQSAHGLFLLFDQS